MKFLADENVEKPIVDLLRDLGHDVLYMPEFTIRTIDEKLLKQANDETRVLITNDKDFGELVFLQKRASGGILLMRFESESSKTKLKFIGALLKNHESRLEGNFTVINESKVRFRKLA